MQQSLNQKATSSISVSSMSLRKWKILGGDLLDTLKKYWLVFSEVPSTRFLSILKNARCVFFLIFFKMF